MIEYKSDTRLLGALLMCGAPALLLCRYFELQQVSVTVAVLFFLGFFAFGFMILRYRRVLLDESKRQVELIDWTPFRRTNKKLPFDSIDCVAIGPETQDPGNDKAEIPIRYLFLVHNNSLERITYSRMSEPDAARLEAERIAAALGGLPVRFVSDLQQELDAIEQTRTGSTIPSGEWRDYVRPASSYDSKLFVWRLGMVSLIGLGAPALAWTIYLHFSQNAIRSGLTTDPLFMTCFIGGFYSLVIASVLYKKMGVIRRSHCAESIRVMGESLEVQVDRVTQTFPLRGLNLVVERRDLAGKKPNSISPQALVLEHSGSEVLVGVGETPQRLQELLNGLRLLQSQLDKRDQG